MAHVIIDMPDDLARSLAEIAAAQHKSVQQLAIEAIERLRSLVEANPEQAAGSAAAVLRAMLEAPHPSPADMDELDAAIALGRLPVRARELFPS